MQSLAADCFASDLLFGQTKPKALHDIIDLVAVRHPTRLVAIDDETSLSYSDLQLNSQHLACLLLTQGLVPKSVQPLGTLMQRSCVWLTVYVATMRCGVPIVSLSVDMKDRRIEEERNLGIIKKLSLQLLIVRTSEKSPAHDHLFQSAYDLGVKVFDMEELSASKSHYVSMASSPQLPAVQEETLLAYMFTGGTTRASKAVRANHAMALHELRTYSEVFPEGLCGSQLRFLQNSSAYWGAALYGQIDVALAGCGTIVISGASLPDDVADAINKFKVTAFGAVPSVLAHIDPWQVPTVRLVISWAENLSDSIACRWCSNVPLRDLLIATEFWLTFYALRHESRALRVVSGVDVRIIDLETHRAIQDSAIGEICLAGATVCPGYVDAEDNKGRFIEFENKIFLRTRDLARWLLPGKSLEYHGRCDDLVKVGGNWVDVLKLESTILEIPKVQDVKLVFQPQRQDAFIVFNRVSNTCSFEGVMTGSNGCKDQQCSSGPGYATIQAIHRALPPGCAVHYLAAAQLPRHPGTGKVDRTSLLNAVKGDCMASVILPRHTRVLSRFARAYKCVATLCHQDQRRVMCLAYIWYALLLCPDFSRVRGMLAQHFPAQGGARGVIFGMAWALPLAVLSRLAAPGVAAAKVSGQGLEWVMVFLAAIPHWLPVPNQGHRPTWFGYSPAKAAEHASASLQLFSAKWADRVCQTCNGGNWITLFPSALHCCRECSDSHGLQHSPYCLQLPVGGWRKCDHCSFTAAKSIIRFCCYLCEREPGTHGPNCQQIPFLAEATEARSTEQITRDTAAVKPCDLQGCNDNSGNNDDNCGNDSFDEKHENDENDEDDENGNCIDVDDNLVATLVCRLGICLENTSTEEPVQNMSIGPLDSLHALRLLAAIRQQLGYSPTLREIAQSHTIGELTSSIRRAVAGPSRRQLFPEPGQAGFRLWTFGWDNCQQWLFRCTQAIDARILQPALSRLVKRQPALRLRLTENVNLQNCFMEAAVILELLRSGTVQDRLDSAKVVVQVLQHALEVGWPRWHTGKQFGTLESPVLVEVECASWELNATIKQLRKWFVPPFQLALLHCPHERDCSDFDATDTRGALTKPESQDFICLMMSHAIADGAAVMPLLHDLAQFCAEEGCRGAPEAPLKTMRSPALPHFGAILEDRLLRTLHGDDAQVDTMYLDRRMDFLGCHFPENRCKGYMQNFHVLASEVRQLKSAIGSHVPGCPVEIVLISFVVLALARVQRRPFVKFTLVHHGRDHPPGAADIVGFFTDFRVVTVPTSEMISLLSVVSFVFATVRERRWRRPEVLEPIETLLNVVPSPFTEIGLFTQVPWAAAKGAQSTSDGKMWQSKKTQPLRRQLEMQIEQVDDEEWSITMYLSDQMYPQKKGREFRSSWLNLLHEFGENPLQAVHGDNGCT